MNGATLDQQLDLLEKELSHLGHTPLAEVPASHRCFDDTQKEFEEFNNLDWDKVRLDDIIRLSDPYIMMPPDTYFFLLPKVFRAIVREGRESDLAATVLEMVLRELTWRADGISLSHGQFSLVYNVACKLEAVIFEDHNDSLADAFLEHMSAH